MNKIFIGFGLLISTYSYAQTSPTCTPQEFWSCTLPVTNTDGDTTVDFNGEGFSRAEALADLEHECGKTNPFYNEPCFKAFRTQKSICIKL